MCSSSAMIRIALLEQIMGKTDTAILSYGASLRATVAEHPISAQPGGPDGHYELLA